MNVLETEWWTLVLPPEWWADSEDESILIGDRDEVGCIEVSTLHKEQGDFTQDNLEEIAREGSDSRLTWQAVAAGDYKGIMAQFVEDGVSDSRVVCGQWVAAVVHDLQLRRGERGYG